MAKAPTKETDLKLLRDMLLIRRFEERAAQQYQMQKIGGFCHLYIGQEAVAVGCVAAAKHEDYLITAYRDHGHALARGTTADACMAELFGKATGCSKGMGGSMHYFDKANNMMGGHAIVGGHVPLAVGMAFASKFKGEDRVTICFFGDGAINQGAFHEALNLASLWQLPVIFVCENNMFAMGTSVQRSTGLKELFQRADGYDIENSKVDGMDVRVVRDHFKKIIDKIRKKPAPHFVEVDTYRYRGHSMSDPANYRTKEELEHRKERDPIIQLRAQLEAEGTIDTEAFNKLDAEVKQIVAESVRFADESPLPPLSELHNYTFVNSHS
jgi:pyruvate dehydrogenase E1 component alpha subunit